MKKILSFLLAVTIIASSVAFFNVTYAANEPTTEELEAIIKIVKPKLDIPEICSDFEWRFNAKNAYNDASWNLTWKTKSDSDKNENVNVMCDTEGRIFNYSYSYQSESKVLPVYYKDDLRKNADDFLKMVVPEVFENVKLVNSYGTGIYSNSYIYYYVRYIGDYQFPDNNVNVVVDHQTGVVKSLSVVYDYDLELVDGDSIISEQKAEEILGTRQKMSLSYLTKIVTDEKNKEKTVKAFLVYSPETGYLAVDAYTGEIYDTKSEWEVRNQNTTLVGGAGSSNGVLMDKMETEAAAPEYRLTDEELAGLNLLDKLISKEDAIKIITENEMLYLDSSLTAVNATLNKNYSNTKLTSYQNDNGSYIWNITFSNPVFDDKYYSVAYADAAVNAENGSLIYFHSNLNDYYYYTENKKDIPDVKYTEKESKGIAEDFLSKFAVTMFGDSEFSSSNKTNIIKYTNVDGKLKNPEYGAYSFRYDRVYEDVAFPRNYLYVGVDGVTGKIFNYNYTWWTNVEFESSKGIITPEKALLHYIDNDGYGLIYERNITYIYKPLTENSKKDVAFAFAASLTKTYEMNGDIDKVIDKYARDIDREKLMSVIGNYEKLLELISAYFGVTSDEIRDTTEKYVDTSLFYDTEKTARLVYTAYDIGSKYVSPFSGKLLTYSGEEYKPIPSSYEYNDIEGHWIYEIAKKLGDIGRGFDGGSFKPDEAITGEDFVKLSQSLAIYGSQSFGKENITKIQAVKSILDSYGFEKIAKLTGIYKTDFMDNAEIKDEDLGYTAIAYGLGIINGDGQNANIYKALTRAEALMILVNSIENLR